MTTPDTSLWSFIINAGFVVKIVILILTLASVTSWMIIFQRTSLFRAARKHAKAFEQQFWSGGDLSKLFQQFKTDRTPLSGLSSIFYAGFREFAKLRKQTGIEPEAVMEGAQRAMRVASSHETEKLEQHLAFLATVGSTSPYIGLFGTVWGILTSFRALGAVQQATISMVAPGISEALIATAIGLFAAIPAVIAYNRFSNDLERTIQQQETFQEEFASILHRKAHNQGAA